MAGQAQARYVEAAEKFGSMRDRVDGLLSTREEAYLGLLEVPDPGEALSSRSSQHGSCGFKPAPSRCACQGTSFLLDQILLM